MNFKRGADDEQGPFLALNVGEGSQFSLFGSLDASPGPAPKRRRLEVVGDGGRVAFVGTDVPHERYIIGIYNRKTNAMTLKETRMFEVRQHVKTIGEDPLGDDSQTVRTKNFTARNQLGETFGSRKRQQAIRAYARNQVNAESTSTEVLDALSAQTHMDAESGDVESVTSVLPPLEQAAGTVEQIYPLEHLHPVLEMQQIPVLKFLRETRDGPGRLLEENGASRSKDHLKQLVHTSYMLKLLSIVNTKLLDDATKVRAKVGAPIAVFEGLAARFLQAKDEKK
ncbi:DNA-directed RNA polymerase I subunit rpa49 [Gonapodya sp. JEL0774]|nr:DNA-directed RNA polymerase I subunit rpa49 [Gonapodya sp. JEL0774]